MTWNTQRLHSSFGTHMLCCATAEVRCSSGSACEPVVMGGHWQDRSTAARQFRYCYLTRGCSNAEVRCVEGCTCEPATMDGYWEERTSQTVGFKVVVSQAATCRLEVTVLEATSSGEHKVFILLSLSLSLGVSARLWASGGGQQAAACPLEATSSAKHKACSHSLPSTSCLYPRWWSARRWRAAWRRQSCT